MQRADKAELKQYEELGFFVNLAPVDSQHLDQEELDEAMAPEDMGREFSTGVGELDTAVGLVGDEAASGESLDHRGDCAGRDGERRGGSRKNAQRFSRGSSSVTRSSGRSSARTRPGDPFPEPMSSSTP